MWRECRLQELLPAGGQLARCPLLLGHRLPDSFGGLIELMVAHLTTYRTGDWMDLLADSLGAIAAYAVCSRVYPKKLNRNEN